MSGAILLLLFSLTLGLAIVTPCLFWLFYWIKKADKWQEFYDLNDIKGNPVATAIYGGSVVFGICMFMGMILGSIILGSFL